MTEPQPDSPVSFGYKISWCAVRSPDCGAIASALGFAEPSRVSWGRGIEAAYAGSVFITPAIDGWTLVVGDAVAPGVERADGNWRSNLVELSERFGEVQMFTTHRVVELHGWALARHGRVERAYCYVGESGEVRYDEGGQTPAEQSLGFNFGDPDSPEAEDETYWEREDLFPCEASVMSLAAKWSVSPIELSEDSGSPALGLVPESKRKPWWRFW